ncbi:MAG: hypothetical protein RI897_3782 [Verrucomicrobiota bacterium]
MGGSSWRWRIWRILGGLGGSPVVFIRLDDALDEGVPDDVTFPELDDGHAFDIAQGVHGFDEAGGFVAWEVDLGDVAGDDGLGVIAEAGEEHEHLFHGTVLGFIEDDKGVVERSSPHVGEGGDFDGSASPVFFDFLGWHHIMEGIVEGAQVGGDFFVEVTREKAESFAGFHGGAG